MMHDLQNAIQSVKRNEAQRICVPGQWRVWREGDKVKFELMGVSHANN